MPNIRVTRTAVFVDGRPMSHESYRARYGADAVEGRSDIEAPEAGVKEPYTEPPSLTPIEKARNARAANLAARKTAQAAAAAAPTVIPTRPHMNQLEAAAAKDLRADELAASRIVVVSTVTPEQIAAADAKVAADEVLLREKLALNAKVGAEMTKTGETNTADAEAKTEADVEAILAAIAAQAKAEGEATVKYFPGTEPEAAPAEA